MSWDFNLYLKFADERKQPCVDLLSQLNGKYDRILDLGCGPGNSTNNLLNKFGNCEIVGFDSDENMLLKAQKDLPNIKFIKGYAPDDFNKLEGKFDLVFSNACIHWIKEQENLIDGVYNLLNENGIFAVQIPITDESQFYNILYDVIDEKWPKLKVIKNFYNLDQHGYYNNLKKRFNNVKIWKTDYYHIIDKNLVLEWYKGSGLRPYLELLDANEKELFLNDLQDVINKKYQLLDDGNVFLIMPRLFFIAKK